MKVFVFVRGIETPFKQQIVQQIMLTLNPDINHITALKVSMRDYGDLSDKFTRKAADRSCKNLVRKILGGSHAETFIVIDNESLQPVNWQSYFVLAEGINVNAIAVGIDIDSPENFIQDAHQKRLNLQQQNLHLFKATMYKYLQVKNEQEIPVLLADLQKLKTDLIERKGSNDV